MTENEFNHILANRLSELRLYERRIREMVSESRRKSEEIKLFIEKYKDTLPLATEKPTKKLTKQEKKQRIQIEKLICNYAATSKCTVAEIVCLFYCFGIADPNKKIRPMAEHIAQKTGFKTDTIRLYLSRYYKERRNNPVKISLNQNLQKVENFAYENNLLDFLTVQTHSRIR